MMIKRLFSVLIVLLFAFTLSCNEKDKSSLLPFAGVNSSTTDGGSDDPSDPGTTCIVPGPGIVKNMLDTLLQKIISSGFVFSLDPVCVNMGFDFLDNETLTIHKQITCSPAKMVMTITMRNFTMKGFTYGMNGVMTATILPSGSGSYVIAISTPAGSPIQITASAGCTSTIELSNLLVSVTLKPYSALYTGIVLINGNQQSLSEFTVPSDLLDLLKSTLGDVFDWLQGLL